LNDCKVSGASTSFPERTCENTQKLPEKYFLDMVKHAARVVKHSICTRKSMYILKNTPRALKISLRILKNTLKVREIYQRLPEKTLYMVENTPEVPGRSLTKVFVLLNKGFGQLTKVAEHQTKV
jgi:hypothetical protein